MAGSTRHDSSSARRSGATFPPYLEERSGSIPSCCKRALMSFGEAQPTCLLADFAAMANQSPASGLRQITDGQITSDLSYSYSSPTSNISLRISESPQISSIRARPAHRGAAHVTKRGPVCGGRGQRQASNSEPDEYD